MPHITRISKFISILWLVCPVVDDIYIISRTIRTEIINDYNPRWSLMTVIFSEHSTFSSLLFYLTAEAHSVSGIHEQNPLEVNSSSTLRSQGHWISSQNPAQPWRCWGLAHPRVSHILYLAVCPKLHICIYKAIFAHFPGRSESKYSCIKLQLF